MSGTARPAFSPRGRHDVRRIAHSGGIHAVPDPLLLVSTLLAAAGALGHSLPLGAAGSVVLAIVSCAKLWSRLALERLAVRRSFSRPQVFAGDRLEIEISVENRKTLPLPWLKLSFVLPEGLLACPKAPDGSCPTGPVAPEDPALSGGRVIQESFSLSRRERVSTSRAIIARQRGCYRLGHAHVESGDLFGLYEALGESSGLRSELVVFPTPKHLPGFSLPPRAPDGASRGRPSLHEDYSRPNGRREYQPGDPLRIVDWKATAQHGVPYVRTYEPSDGQRVVLLLESGTGDVSWRFRPERLEAAVTAAASGAFLAIEEGYEVGLLTNGLGTTGSRRIVLPAGGRRQLEVLLHTLARIQPMPALPLHRLYEEVARRRLPPPRHTTVLYVTARPDGSTIDLIERACRSGALARCLYVGEQPFRSLPFLPVYDASAQCKPPPGRRPARNARLYA